MASKCLILVVFAVNLIYTKTSVSFTTQFLGSYLSDEEYKSQSLCWTKICMLDSGRLIYAASHNSSSIDPCQDFAKFSMGEFLEHRVLHERYKSIGFDNDVKRVFEEKQRKVLNKAVQPDDETIFKVIKSFFKKCTNSDQIAKQSGKDIISYLNRLGGSPLVTEGSWNEENFNIMKIFDSQPDHALRLFFDDVLKRCQLNGIEFLCFQMDTHWNYTNERSKDTMAALLPLNLNRVNKAEALENFNEFLEICNQIHEEFKALKAPEIIRVRNLQKRFPELSINWLSIINNQLLKTSQVTENEEISIENPKLFSEILKALVSFKKSFIANVFTTSFLYIHRKSFQVYSFLNEDESYRGTKRSYQRFEQCLHFLGFYMSPALEALMAKTYFDQSTQRAAEELVVEAVKDSLAHIKSSKLLNETMKEKLVEKLTTVKLSVMFQEEILDSTKIVEIYGEFDTKESDSFVEMLIKMVNYDKKLENEPRTNWIKDFKTVNSNLKNNYVIYLTDENILNIPLIFTLYPNFHPKRPRFFNMATLYMQTIYAINTAVRNLTGKSTLANYVLAYKNYVNWESNGCEDLKLGAFKMTTRQMFWLSLAHRSISKYHKSVPKNVDERVRLSNEYFNVRMKNRKDFRDAFQCNQPTAEEKKLFKEYKNKVTGSFHKFTELNV